MNTGMTYQLAINRLLQKISYLERKAAEATDEKTRHFATLDREAFQLAVDCMTFAQEYSQYESSKNEAST
jgi:hypothetical protein